MHQQFNPPCGRALARRLSGYLTVFAALLLTLIAPQAHAAAACNVVYATSPQNSSAFGATIAINNTGTTAWTSWSLTWTFANGQTVASLWNGIETQSGANVTVTNEPYNGSVAAGGSVSGVGFNGTWNGTTNAVPASFAVNGVTCGGTLTATTTALTASTTTPKVGASVTLTATVSPSAATGTVTFMSGTTSLGTGTLASGVATLATSFAAVGTDSLTAVYGGSTTDATSTSSAVSVTVSAAATTTVLTASTTTPAVGASVTLTATVSPAAATGTVTFMSGTTSLGTGTLSAGVATLATSFATAGTYSLTAVYAGSTNYTTSTSSAVSVTASAKTATTTTLTASTTTPKVGASVTLTATVSPTAATGTVTFMSGTTSLGTGTLSAGVATLTTSFAAAGTDSLTAVYGGSTTYATSTSSAVSVTVTTTATTTTLTASTTTPKVGASVTLTATVSPAAATGTVTFMSGTTSLGTGTLSSGVATLTTSFAAAGTDSLTAVYGGSAAYATSTSTAVSITVSGTTTPTTTALTASTTTPTVGASVTLTATVSPAAATGTVTFMSGTTSLGTGTLSSGVATLVTSFATAGTDSITAVYAGSTTYAGSTSSAVSVTVATGGASFSLWATAATMSIPQSDSGSDTVNVLGANGFAGLVTLTVSGLPTGVTAVLDANPTTGTSGLILTVASTAAAATSTITISGTSGSLSASTTIALTVTASTSKSFLLTPSAATLSIAAGSSSPESISITDISPFSGSVTFAASGLPTGVTATWTSNPSTTSGILTLTAASTAVAGTSTITITGTSGSATATTTVALTVTAATGLACNIGYNIGNQSTSGSAGSFGGTLTINNTGTVAWTSWTLTWTWANGQTFQSLWGGTETQSGANVTITSLSYDGAIPAGGNTGQVGFNANWNGVTNAMPTNFAINGTTCSAVGSGSASGGSGFTLLAAASPVTLNQGSSSTDTITVKDFGGFAGSVTLAASGLPSGVTAAFGTNPTTGSSVVTFTSGASLPAALTSVTITGTSGTTTASAVLGLNVAGYTTVSVNTTTKGIAVSDQILGMDMAAWYDIVTNQDVIVDSFLTAGIKSVRWPGGSWSDVYHWATNTNCQNAPYGGGTPDTGDTFANFVNDIVKPAGLDVALTADYGTNPACTGGGVPSEAAAWVTNALSLGLTVSHMTVGNEVYGSTWEEDLHSPANNAAEYASTMIGSSGFYDTIKAASPNTLVGISIDEDNTAGGWDNTVMANAKGYYDFVEYHFYPEAPGFENDSTLINQDAQLLTTNLNIIKAELAEWGTPNTPIYVGEIGGPYGTPGKQSMSITQALYAGQVLGEAMNDGMTRLTWWLGYGGCADASFSGNYSSTLYGWQDFGGYMIFSDGLTDYYQCTAETLAPGILLPTARAFQLFSNVAVTGENVLSASVSGDTADVVAYAATHSGGTALFLVNRNETASQSVSITLSGQTTASSVTVMTYDKAIYDLSGSPTGTFPDPLGTSTWAPPTTTTISSPTLPLSLTLPPWSMNVVIIP